MLKRDILDDIEVIEEISDLFSDFYDTHKDADIFSEQDAIELFQMMAAMLMAIIQLSHDISPQYFSGKGLDYPIPEC